MPGVSCENRQAVLSRSISLLTLLMITVLIACANSASKTPVATETSMPAASAATGTSTPSDATAAPTRLVTPPLNPTSSDPDVPEPTIPAFARMFDGPASSCRSSKGWETHYREGEPGLYLYDTSFGKHFIEWTEKDSRIVFGSEEAVWTIESSGGKQKLVVDANPGLRQLEHHALRFGFHADVSPDGTRIVYATCQFLADSRELVESRIEKYGLDHHDAARNHYEIAAASMDGRDIQRLTENEKIDHFPVWSPNGKRIAFIADSSRSHTEPFRCDGEQLYTMMPDGSDVRWITKTLAFESIVEDENGYIDEKSVVDIALSPPQWSPDGRHLAFVVNEGDCRVRSRALYTVRDDGTDVKRISRTLYRDDQPATPPAWSPDGERIAFVDGDSEQTSIYTVRLGGTDLNEIWSHRNPESPLPVKQLSWSPDGSEILFISADLWVAKVDGSDLRKLGSNASVVTWSPDGARIAVYIPGADKPYDSEGYVQDTGQLYTMNRDGSDVRVLFE